MDAIQLDVVRSFWDIHYENIDPNGLIPHGEKVTLQDAYDHFQREHPSRIDVEAFHYLSNRLGLLKSRRKSRHRIYYVRRVKNRKRHLDDSDTSFLPKRPKLTEKTVDIFVFNSRGLITEKENKCKFISDLIVRENCDQILCLTESWLQSTIHKNEEVTLTFNSHHVCRSDRDVKRCHNGMDGEKSKQGGCLTVTSNPLPCKNLGQLVLFGPNLPQKWAKYPKMTFFRKCNQIELKFIRIF